jgi:hypothetical protein
VALKSNKYLVKLWKKTEIELIEEHIISKEDFENFICPIGFRATYEEINEKST